MAQITVRPVADISKYGDLTYSSGTDVYPMINEVNADNGVTRVRTTTQNVQLFQVACTHVDTSKISYINTITVYFRCTGNNGNYNLYIGYGFSSPTTQTAGGTVSAGYQTFSNVFTINDTPANFDLNQLYLVCTGVSNLNSKQNSFDVDQMYAVIDYVEVPTSYIKGKAKVNGVWHDGYLLEKVNGVWKTVSHGYGKIGSTWHGG